MAAAGQLGDVLPLGEHGNAVGHDLVDGDLGQRSHRLGCVTRPDPGLYVARSQGAVHLDLQLAEPGTVASKRRAKPVVCGGRELGTRVVDEDALRGALDAIVNKAHEIGLSESEIGTMLAKAVQ
jgi:hypothetical protein